MRVINDTTVLMDSIPTWLSRVMRYLSILRVISIVLSNGTTSCIIVLVSKTLHRLPNLIILILFLLLNLVTWFLISKNGWFHICFISRWRHDNFFLLSSSSFPERKRSLIRNLLVCWCESFRIWDHLIISIEKFILLEIIITQEYFIVFVGL